MNRFKAWLCTWSIPEFKYLDSDQRFEVYDGFIKYNLSLKQVKVYALERVNYETMRVIKKALAKGISCRDMEICRDMDISDWRLARVVEGLLSGIDGEDILKYLDPNISDSEAFRIFSEVIHQKK